MTTHLSSHHHSVLVRLPGNSIEISAGSIGFHNFPDEVPPAVGSPAGQVAAKHSVCRVAIPGDSKKVILMAHLAYTTQPEREDGEKEGWNPSTLHAVGHTPVAMVHWGVVLATA